MTERRSGVALLVAIGIGLLALSVTTAGAIMDGSTSDVEVVTNGSISIDGSLNVSASGGAESTVGPPPLSPAMAGPPTDVDGDGRYEDLNGNGRVDFDDVVQYFVHIRKNSIGNHVTAYDYNDNGRIDFDDIVSLFREV